METTHKIEKFANHKCDKGLVSRGTYIKNSYSSTISQITKGGKIFK